MCYRLDIMLALRGSHGPSDEGYDRKRSHIFTTGFGDSQTLLTQVALYITDEIALGDKFGAAFLTIA